jgi:hypothetical protein
MIHLDSHVTGEDEANETAFTQTMGHMDVIGFMANYFNVYFPCVLVILCLATLLRLGSRILNCFGVQQFFEDDEMSTDYTSEGKEYVRIERKRRGQDPDRRKTSSHPLVEMRSRLPGDRAQSANKTGNKRGRPVDLDRAKYSRRMKSDDHVELMTSMEGGHELEQHSSRENSSLNDYSGRSRDGSLVVRGIFGDM